ncbi:serine protease 42-like [Leptidea sinapis]|uniref:serine protease 42-like n=1 Tax=Leptidea sinapis TaxID=189913 RepID=UPI0021C30F58|nr:serine protease 42-like [Leptidea sinapis]
MEPHVVSGDKVTNIQFFSHSAFISVCKGEWFVCGSSLLNQRILITAGHCITGRRKIVKIYAYTGHVRYQKGLKIPASNFIVHPKYGKNPMQHDIGLVMLQVAVPFGLNITRVAIYQSRLPIPEGAVAGWGLINKEMRITTDFLYATKQKIWSLDECRHVLTRTLSEGFICGGDLNIKSFTAKGDSGSALIVDKITQVGLVSHKIPNKSKSLTVYTDVSYYYYWIVENSLALFNKENPCTTDANKQVNADVTCKYASINEVIRRAFTALNKPAILQPNISCRDGKRPDRTLVSWVWGRALVWNATCIDNQAPHHVQVTGDSGSALIVDDYIQVGIVSHKIPRASRSLTLYTDTSYYYDWIRDSVRFLHCRNSRRNSCSFT